jgi:flagellar basal body-associated protein FliL
MEENIQKKKKPIKLLIGIILIVIIAVVVILFLTSKEGKETVNLIATLDCFMFCLFFNSNEYNALH